MAESLTRRALNRALLARQGLLDPYELPVEQVVERIGAIQAQYWPAVPVALYARMRGFATADLYRVLEDRRLLSGTLLRGTLHVVSARDHPVYAAAVEASAPRHLDPLRSALFEHARTQPVDADGLVEFVEDWLARHPDGLPEADVSHQRTYRWRPLKRWSALVRTPVDGRWGPRVPAALAAAPTSPEDWPDPGQALMGLVQRHLRAFGPAAAEDIGQWAGLKTGPVKEALRSLEAELITFADESGRTLYDLPDAARPDPGVPAPVRLLPWFDSVLLAYAPRHRSRILPDAYKDRVYVAANLQWLPSFLVDGMVAGTWSLEAARKEATLTLVPFAKLSKAERAELLAEAERLLGFMHPSAPAHRVLVAG